MAPRRQELPNCHFVVCSVLEAAKIAAYSKTHIGRLLEQGVLRGNRSKPRRVSVESLAEYLGASVEQVCRSIAGLRGIDETGAVPFKPASPAKIAATGQRSKPTTRSRKPPRRSRVSPSPGKLSDTTSACDTQGRAVGLERYEQLRAEATRREARTKPRRKRKGKR